MLQRLIVIIQAALILKTTVGHALQQFSPENVAFIIASFLVEDQEGNRANECYKQLCATLYGTTVKGDKVKLDRYCKTLRYDSFLSTATTQQ